MGYGVMGEAFATALARAMPQVGLLVYDARRERGEAATRGWTGPAAMAVARSADEVFSGTDATLLCVKPQDMAALADEVRGSSKGRRIVSILAGRTIQKIGEAFATDQVCRFMPNLAAVTGSATVGVSFHPKADAETRELGLSIAKAAGTAVEIPEKLMSAITGVSGSGLAYVFAFAHAMALGGVASGFDYSTALSLAVSTLEGAASLLRKGTHPQELISRVTSPGGTTIQGVRALERGGFTAAVMEAVEAAAQKASDFEA